MFSLAGRAEILRSSQRDQLFQQQLQTCVSDIALQSFGVHQWMKYREKLKQISSVLYYSVTTLSNLQTLGEEYTGIVQVGETRRILPGKQVQILMILLNIYGENFINLLLIKFEEYIKSLSSDHPLREEARRHLVNTSAIIRKTIPLALNIHKTVFYFKGRYYSLSKRLTKVQYILVRHWMKDVSSREGFRILGIISSITLTLHLLTSVSTWKSELTELEPNLQASTSINSSGDTCSLCLNSKQYPTVITCGHVFCWECILQWLQEQPHCPLCREPCQSSRAVYLQNYSELKSS